MILMGVARLIPSHATVPSPSSAQDTACPNWQWVIIEAPLQQVPTSPLSHKATPTLRSTSGGILWVGNNDGGSTLTRA